jgi:hypothetical protein
MSDVPPLGFLGTVGGFAALPALGAWGGRGRPPQDEIGPAQVVAPHSYGTARCLPESNAPQHSEDVVSA